MAARADGGRYPKAAAQIGSETDSRIRRLLDRLIAVERRGLVSGAEGGDRTAGSGSQPESRVSHDPPTSLAFADSQPLLLELGRTTTVRLRTDGPDQMLTRTRRPARLTIAVDGVDADTITTQAGSLSSGTIPLIVRTNPRASAGIHGAIVATLEMKPSTFLKAERRVRVVPPPPSYVGNDPPSLFDFASSSPCQLEVGRTASITINTDSQNDILDRLEAPGRVATWCNLAMVEVSYRNPRDGKLQVLVTAKPEANPGDEGRVAATLTLPDGTAFETSRTLRLIPYQPSHPSRGTEQAPIPSYEIVRVWEFPPEDDENATTWGATGSTWDSSRVGDWGMNGDILYLYVNMDQAQFAEERRRWVRQSQYVTAGRLSDRYVAYIAYHLFQMYEACERSRVLAIQEQSRNKRTWSKEPLAIPPRWSRTNLGEWSKP